MKTKRLSKSGFGTPADTILYNGKIITVDKDFTIASAVAIRNGKFVAVGKDSDVKVCAGSNTEIINLNGQTVLPGVIDSHTHPVRLGKNLLCPVQMCHVKMFTDVLEAIAHAAKKASPGEWIVGAENWRHHDVDHLPMASELDSVAPNNPVWLPAGGHRGCANTMALRLAGITRDSMSPAAGTIFKDLGTGEPTGRLDETAQKLVKGLLPKIDLVESLKEACTYYNSIGVTGIGNEGIDQDEQEAYSGGTGEEKPSRT